MKVVLDPRAPNVTLGLCNKWGFMTVCFVYLVDCKSKEPTTSSDQHKSAHSKSGTWATRWRHLSLSYLFIGVSAFESKDLNSGDPSRCQMAF